MHAFGQFIAENRRTRGLTQRELAESLHVTDKAVSKWERGLSYPDVTLLEPLAAKLELMHWLRRSPANRMSRSPQARDAFSSASSNAVFCSMLSAFSQLA